jgi:cell division protein ZapA (FtsZ GTPase activity inhibitor)
MSTVSVKVKIAGRYYPLNIQQEEEATLRQAEAKIQSNIDAFQEKYGVKDMQDLLAMTLLQMATKSQHPTTSLDNSTITQLEKLNALTESMLVEQS